MYLKSLSCVQFFAIPWTIANKALLSMGFSRQECEPWVSVRNTHYGYGICPDEDEFLIELTCVYHRPNVFSAKRILFELSDDLWDMYMDQKEALGV